MPRQELVPFVARMVVSGAADGVSIVNIFHVKGTAAGGAFTQGELDNLTNAFAGSFKTRFQSMFANAYAFQNVVATDLSTTFGVVSTATMTGNGSAGVTSAPNNVCIGLSWKIARHYRGGHPRTYIGPIATAQVGTGTTILAAAVTNAKAAGAGLISDVVAIAGSGAPAQLVAVHRISAGAILQPPLVDTITAVGVDSRIDSQRKRLGKDRPG